MTLSLYDRFALAAVTWKILGGSAIITDKMPSLHGVIFLASLLIFISDEKMSPFIARECRVLYGSERASRSW